MFSVNVAKITKHLREAIHHKLPRETSSCHFRWVSEFWKIILTFSPWQIYSKVKYEQRTLKLVKIQQQCIRSSVRNQLIIDNGKRPFNHSSVLAPSFSTIWHPVSVQWLFLSKWNKPYRSLKKRFFFN